MQLTAIYHKCVCICRPSTKILRIMQLTSVLLLGLSLQLSATGISQTISFSGKDVPLEQVFRVIKKQTGYFVSYKANQVRKASPVTITGENMPVEVFLHQALKDQPLDFSIEETTIFIKWKRDLPAPVPVQPLLSLPLPVDITLRGVVTNNNNEPLEGVSVVVKGTQNGTVTDAEGRFQLSVPSVTGVELEFSFVGFETKILAVGQETVFNVVLDSSVTGLEDVVVVGYGTQKKATLTGAVVSTTGREIKQSPATNLSNSLVGRLPGLIGVTRSGEPGSDGTTLLIRGSNTLGNNAPLVVVDGIAGRDFTRLNPSDIENITVLKDASAAIYGAQAANGVILVTTKRGKTGKPTISLNLNKGFQQPTVIPEMADASQYATLLNELSFYLSPDLGLFQRFSEEDIQKYSDGSDPWGHPNTDWFRAVFKPWSGQGHEDVSVSGGTESIKYFLSAGISNQDGVYKNSGTKYSEYNLRSNIDARISKNVSISFDLAGSWETKDYAVKGVGSIFRSIFRGHPNAPAYWPDGTPGPSFLEFGDQPVVTSTKEPGYNLDKIYRFQSNGRINIKIPWIDGLSVQGNISADKIVENQKIFSKPWILYTWDGNPDLITVPGKVGLASPELTQNINDGRIITMNAYVTYEHTIREKHDIKFMAGTEKQTGDNNFLNANRQNFLSAAIDQLFAGAADQFMTNTGSASQTARLNYFGRMNYAFNDKYLLEFVWRDDASYIFPENKRFGFFPGISAGWQISEERFWKDNLKFINVAKIRASWGQTGNDRITPFQYISTYGFSGNYVYNVDNLQPRLQELRIPNPNVTWEVANQTDIGIDVDLLKRKLSVSFDYFHNIRSNILWQRNASIPASSGLTLPPENIGKVDNRGWEGMISYRDQINEFIYNISATGSFQKNEIIFWDETPGVPDYQRSTGRPMGSQLYYISLGVFKDQADVDKYPHWSGARPGDVIFKDVNNDGKIDGLDQVRNAKNDLPTFTGSFTLNLQYRQFDLSMLIQGASGSQKYITVEGGQTGNIYKLWADNRWTPDNQNSNFVRVWDYQAVYWDNPANANTYWLYPSDYIRLKNIELGYSLPPRFNKRMGIQRLRIYINALNLITVSGLVKNKMMDPESLNNYSYPLQRIINGGLTLMF